MKTIRYRKIEEKDYSAVGEILNRSFGLHNYVSHQKTLDYFKLQYVYSCLAEATYTCVAEENGQIIGVIMGNSKNDYKVLKHLPYIIRTIKYDLMMKYFSRKNKSELEGYKNMHKVYYDFHQKHKHEFDGVLTLFAVDESYRGKGVGKTLLSNFLKYLREQETKYIYLYTDTTCNYGFYEHEGFKRLEEQELTLIKHKRPFQMNVFLYGYFL